jgi:RHS repeat-associated protein
LRAIGYTYDAIGNVLTVTDPDAKYTYGYDALNRISSVDNAGTSGVPTVAFNYLYDTVGRLVTVTDRINNSNAGQTDYAFDQLNRVTKITQSGTGVQSKRVDMAYNQVNQMTGLNRFSDLGGVNLVAETSYTFDQSQRLTQLAHKKGANNLASYDYTYDSANKLTKIVSSVDGTVDYTYDATNQLTGADHSSQADEAYEYDANGNRTNAGYQTGTNNQLLAAGQFTYEYDQEGNRTKRTETATGKVTEYVWDYHNRLTGVMFKDTAGAMLKNIDYTYDVNNQRIGKKIDGVVTERYVLDRNQIALVFDGQGVQKSRYLYGTQVDQVLAEESGTQVRWFLADHQGTIKDVVDNAGAVIDHITYDSFGRIVGQTNPIDLRFAYTGREWDGETGQYYYRARYYDPADGRFISEDPIGFSGGDSNLSRYVGNSPTNFIDPDGTNPIPVRPPFNPPRPFGNPFQRGVTTPRPGERGYVSDGNMGNDLIDLVKKVNDFFIPSAAKAELPPNLRRKVKIAPTTDFRNNGFYGPQDIRYGPPEPTSAQRTRNRTQVNNNPALPRSPGRGRNPVRPSVNETVVTNDIPVVLTPGGNEPYCPASPIPNRKPEGFPSIPPYIPPVLGGIDLGSILQDLGIESFPGILGALDDLFIPYFETNRVNANELRANLTADGQIANAGDQPHHIVPALDGRTLAAREVRARLAELGVDVNEAANGVFLSADQHRQQWLHRGKTYELIIERLEEASNVDEAREILRQIGSEIRDGEFPPNRE